MSTNDGHRNFQNPSQSPAYLNDIVSFKHISYSFGRRQTVEIPQLRTTNVGTTIQSELILVPPMVYLY